MSARLISVFEYYFVYIRSLIPIPHRAYFDNKLVVQVVSNMGNLYRLTFADGTERIVSGTDRVTIEDLEQ